MSYGNSTVMCRDMWYCLVDSLWAEFEMPGAPQRPVPLIDAVPLAAWVYTKAAGNIQGFPKKMPVSLKI